jgi:isopentenyl-diphosphate delta-isomerase
LVRSKRVFVPDYDRWVTHVTGTTAGSVIDIVDPTTGEPVGTAKRSEALEAGLAIRTVHIFLFDDEGRLLLQLLGRERDRHPLLWGSSVAAFPRPSEHEDAAATRRLSEELGLSVALRKVGRVQTIDGSSLKFVTLFEGQADTPRILEQGHVERVEYRPLPAIDSELAENPSIFTDTFRQVYSWWRERSRA